MSMSDLYPSGTGLPATARPARCECVSAAVVTFAETLACPLRWWPRCGGGWEHAPRRTR